jgi:PhnB protein
MQINPYLNFDGHCEEAFQLYAKCLNGKVEYLATYEGSPAEAMAPPEWRKKVLHVSLTAGGNVIMGCDAPPGHFNKPQGFAVSLNLKDAAETERIFKELSAGGTVQMPLQKTFFAESFAMFTDRFGTPWMVVCNAMQ